jgi:hypothetical protein
LLLFFALIPYFQKLEILIFLPNWINCCLLFLIYSLIPYFQRFEINIFHLNWTMSYVQS